MTELVKQAGGIIDGMSREEIENRFKVEFLSYAMTLAVIDCELTADKIKSLEDIFDITLDSDKIHALVENYKEFLKRENDVPNIYKIAIVVDNVIASNK